MPVSKKVSSATLLLGDAKAGGISTLSAFMMLTTWSTSSSNVLYPFCFGVLGTVGGPLMMLATFFISWKVTRWTVEAALLTESETFGELGFALCGSRGRLLFEGSQILFQQLFLPVAIVLCTGAAQSMLGADAASDITSFAACNGNMAVLFSVVGFALVQVSRQLESVVSLAYVSCALMLTMTAAMVIEVITHEAPVGVDQHGGPELFLGMGGHPDRYHWANVAGAIGVFVYSCLPSCIVVETMAALRPEDRPRMARTVDASFIVYSCIYLTAGLPAVLVWGGDLPQPLLVSNSRWGMFVKFALVCGTMLDFVLASITVNRWLLRMLRPNFDYRWSFGNALTWARCSLPSGLAAVLMALAVPRLESLTGILNSVAGATLQLMAVPLCLGLTSNIEVQPLRRWAGGAGRWRLAMVVLFAMLFTVTVFSAALYTMAMTRYTPGANETFWCDLAG